MRTLFRGVSIVILSTLVYLMISANTIGAPSLAYVYSDSMEPVININDAFIVWPSDSIEVGDIIMFRPVYLDAERITHRVIDIVDGMYVTKGDNSPVIDQDANEKLVSLDRVVGKIVEFNGEPLIFPGVGKLSSLINTEWLGITRLLAFVFLIAGIIQYKVDKNNKYKRSSRKKWRLRDVYRILIILSIVLVIFTLLVSSRTRQIKYLVSESPGSFEDQVKLYEEGLITLNVENRGILPTWLILDTIDPLYVKEAPRIIWGLSEEQVLVTVEPQEDIGFYQGYIKMTNYPILAPRVIMESVHEFNNYLAIFLEGVLLGVWLIIFISVLNIIPGYSGWIPLSTMKSKLLNRKLKRLFIKVSSYNRRKKIWKVHQY